MKLNSDNESALEELVVNLDEIKNRWPELQKKINHKNIALEIGCGKGRFLRDISLKNPGRFHLGLEIQRSRAFKTAQKCREAQVTNALVLWGSMEKLFELMGTSMRFETIYLNFPDPWPKKRHARRRLISPEKVALYWKFLKRGGFLVFVTDDPCYALEGQRNIRESLFQDVFGGFRHHWFCYPVTIHEEKFRRQGREIYYQKFVKFERSK